MRFFASTAVSTRPRRACCAASRLIRNFAPALNNLGEVYRERGDLERASEQYRKAIQIEPQGAAPYNNLGIATHDLGDPVTAIGLYQKAIELGTNYVDAVNNLATSYLDLRRTDEAMRTFRQAIAMDPQNVDAHNNLGYALLLVGEFAEGWEEYEWRWKCAKFPSPRRGFRQPLWNGEDIAGRRILVHAEQGLGDAIHFLRYVPMVAERGAHVILECKQEMTSMLKDYPGVKELVTFGDRLPPFEWQVPMLSLPRARSRHGWIQFPRRFPICMRIQRTSKRGATGSARATAGHASASPGRGTRRRRSIDFVP